MAKFEIERDGQKEELELDDAMIIEQINTNDKGIWEKLFQKLGLKRSQEKESDKDNPKPSTTDNYEDKMSDKDKKEYLELQAKVQELEEKLQKMNESSTASALENTLNKALSEGRIAKAEIETFKKKFDTVYSKNIEILKDVLEQRKPDEKLIGGKSSASSDDAPKDQTGGQPSFTRSQISDPKFFAANKEAIKKAYENDNIID